jgi:hypothetical protein
MMTKSTPISLSMSALTLPVKAPWFSQCTSCAASLTLLPLTTSATLASAR